MDQLQKAVGDAYIQIDNDANELKKKLAAYGQLLRGGGDPNDLPNNENWWNNPIQPYAPAIVNAWREQNGIPPNPIHPGNKVAFQMFDLLLSGEWISNKKLSAMAYGSRVTTYLKDHVLNDAGYALEKSPGNPVVYRMVKLGESVTR